MFGIQESQGTPIDWYVQFSEKRNSAAALFGRHGEMGQGSTFENKHAKYELRCIGLRSSGQGEELYPACRYDILESNAMHVFRVVHRALDAVE